MKIEKSAHANWRRGASRISCFYWRARRAVERSARSQWSLILLAVRVARAEAAAVKGVRLCRRRREEPLRCASGALDGAAPALGWAIRIEVVMLVPTLSWCGVLGDKARGKIARMRG